jgi:serine/threonine protein kinase
MEERYEIKGKIAQGGLGSVYKAHDLRMSRDVAIKRILIDANDKTFTSEATRQLIKEASALASLQHPNIVTIYDVGQDDEGPFVVMELLTGQTLEEIVSNGSFTWEDFRQLAMQSLEAIIAAQELQIVHRDIKPGNIMLTWLPSGKFQVKVVDFGLAKLSTKPSLQTIDQSDGVFGSIYFMGPEQFERIPIDQRVDLYALGSVFYYALTGTYAFDGENVVEVMTSHLQHHVTSIEEVRAGIPLWVCNWIMWLINRQPADRPASARDALLVFMQNDSASSSPEMSLGKPASAVQPGAANRGKLLIPGAAPAPEPSPTDQRPIKTASTPKALAPPQGSKPSIHHQTQAHQISAPEPEPEPEPEPTPPSQIQPSLLSRVYAPPAYSESEPTEEEAYEATESQDYAPLSADTPEPAAQELYEAPESQAYTPPSLNGPKATGFLTKPALGASSQKALTSSHQTSSETKTSEQTLLAPKKGMSNSLKIMLAAVLGIVLIITAFVFVNKKRGNAEIALFNEMIVAASKEGATEVMVDKNKLEVLLQNAATTGEQKDRYVIYMALYLAKATDSTNVDARIAEFATTETMHPDIRVTLIRDVLGKRKNSSIVPTLLNYAKSTDDTKIAIAALEASRYMAKDSHFKSFLEVLQNTSNEAIRKAAEDNIGVIIKKSSSKTSFRSALVTTYSSSPTDTVKHAALRLLGYVGGEQALGFVKESLNSSNVKDKMAALGALGNWTDNAGFGILMDYIKTETDLRNRALAFDTAIKYASESETNAEENWKKISEQSKTEEDQQKLITGLANCSPDPWVFAILQDIVKTSDGSVIRRAEGAINYLEKKKKNQGDDPKEEDK